MVVIGENVVTPSSIVYLLVKLWISPPDATLAVGKKELSVEETKHLALAIANLKEDKLFLALARMPNLKIWMLLQRMDMPMHLTGPE